MMLENSSGEKLTSNFPVLHSSTIQTLQGSYTSFGPHDAPMSYDAPMYRNRLGELLAGVGSVHRDDR